MVSACPVFIGPLYKSLVERFGREATTALGLFFETPAFKKFYGEGEVVVDKDFNIYSLAGEKIGLDKIVRELVGQAKNLTPEQKQAFVIVSEETTDLPMDEPGRAADLIREMLYPDGSINLRALRKKALEGGVSRFAIKALDKMMDTDNLANIRVKLQTHVDSDVLGSYSRSLNTISLMPHNMKYESQIYTTLIHELVHGFTVTPFSKVTNALGIKGKDLTTQKLQEAISLGKLETLKAREQRYLFEVLTAYERAKKAFPYASYYGLSAPEEFIAEFLSDKTFSQFLEKYQFSIFKKIVDAVLSFLGIKTSSSIEEFAEFLYEEIEEESSNTTVRPIGGGKADIEIGTYFKVSESPTFKGVRLTLDETQYVDAQGNLYERLTSWVREKFSNNPITFDELIKKRATKDFESQNKQLTETISVVNDLTGQPEEYTFEQWIARKKINQTTAATKGSIVHLMIEKRIREMLGQDVTELDNRIKDLAEAKEGQNPISLRALSWIADQNRLNRIFDALGFNFSSALLGPNEKDKIEAEVPAVSKLLGLGTTIDMVIQHSNGDYSLVDWKSGEGFFSNELISLILKYSTGYVEVPDSNVSKAKLELVLRALMIKEDNLSARFRELSIVHLEKYQDARIIPADLQTFLPIIEAYVKAEKSEVYNEMKDKGLFSPEAYLGLSKSQVEMEQDRQALTEDKEKLEELYIMDATMQGDIAKMHPTDVRRQNVLNATVSLVERTLGRRAEFDDQDMSPAARWLGNIYSAGNDLVQGFVLYFQKAKTAARKELDELFQKEEKLMKAVQDEYYAANPGKKFADEYLFFGGTDYTKEGQGLFDFMWEYRTGDVGTVSGYYMRTITEDDVKAGRYTQAQYEYNKFQRETMEAAYKETMLDPNFAGKTRAELEGTPLKLPNGFAPRLFAGQDELKAKYGLLSKDRFKLLYRRALSSFLESEQYGVTKKASIPLKYLGSTQLIESGNHTFNSQSSYRMFMTNLVMKKYLDPAQALGQGVKAVLDFQGEKSHADPDHYKQAKGFVQSLIDMHIENADTPEKLARKSITMFGKKVAFSKVTDTLKTWVSSTSMWLNIPGGLANTVLINMLNIKRAIEGSIGNSDVTGFNMSDLAFGYKEWSLWCKDSMLKRENKLENIAKKLDFMPNNYDYAAHSSKMLTTKYKMWDKSKLYLFHSVGEDMGQLTLLAAMLKHMKHPKTGESLWDCLDEQGNWKSEVPARGVTANGVPITSLTTEEILTMKRTTTKLHGGYRHDERTALEATALGRWLLLFKKYLPAILELNFKTYYKDNTSGYWEAREAVSPDGLFDKNGNPVFKTLPDGTKETIYDWRARVQEGRVWLLFKFLGDFTNFSKNPNYSLKNLRPEQKQELISMAVTGVFIAAILSLTLGFDDDDEERPIYQRIIRLAEDISQGLNPIDSLKALNNTQLVVAKMLNLTSGSFTFLVDGVIQGERTRAGRLPGEVNLIKSVPILNTLYGADRFFETEVYEEIR